MRPVLFNLFTNDLEKEVNRKLTDDLKLLIMVRIRTDCEEVQKYYVNLKDWGIKV